MAFQKGQSGNPGGRAHRVTTDGRTLRQICRDHTDDAVKVLVNILTTSESESAQLTAAKELLDRGWGRATQPISGDDEADPIKTAVDVSALSTAALRELAKVCA